MPKIPLSLRRPPKTIEPFWETTDHKTVRLYHGDVIAVLQQMPAKSVQCVVTSPPYWGLRDYGEDKSLEIGSEKTPDEFVAKMVAVFREVRRVLRDDGTLWLNLGDSYNANTGAGFNGNSKRPESARETVIKTANLKPGNLVGIPWRVALALQADGWVLRQDIIWHKPSPMPESVKNRCTKAHEYIFLLTKSQRYFYDAEAIKEKRPGAKPWTKRNDQKFVGEVGSDTRTGFSKIEEGQVFDTANKRSVWTVSSQGYDGAHFATFPPKLIEPCIKAGTSEKGCCAKCCAPWRRVTADLGTEGGHQHQRRGGEGNPYRLEKQTGLAEGGAGANWITKTVGWEPTCECNCSRVVPCVVADIFVGSGTTCCVAIAHGRRSVGIDLSKKYLKNNAIPRIEGGLLSRPALARLTGKTPKRLRLGDPVEEVTDF